MQETSTAFETLGWHTGLLVVLLSAFGYGLRLLWKFFTSLLNDTMMKNQKLIDKYDETIRCLMSTIDKNNFLLQQIASRLEIMLGEEDGKIKAPN